MSTRLARFLVAACLVVGVAAVIVARRASPDDIAPETPAVSAAADLPVLADAAPAVQAAGWINTEPITEADLRGNVVLYDFWTFGCYNCVNTLPYIQAWHERYAADGLIVLSIHTPEFDYERDPEAVADFVAAHGLTYPVALDPYMHVWRAFENRYWPRFYLHDTVGRRRYEHIGEGRYTTTENAIRVLLGVDPDSTWAPVPG